MSSQSTLHTHLAEHLGALLGSERSQRTHDLSGLTESGRYHTAETLQEGISRSSTLGEDDDIAEMAAMCEEFPATVDPTDRDYFGNDHYGVSPFRDNDMSRTIHSSRMAAPSAGYGIPEDHYRLQQETIASLHDFRQSAAYGQEGFRTGHDYAAPLQRDPPAEDLTASPIEQRYFQPRPSDWTIDVRYINDERSVSISMQQEGQDEPSIVRTVISGGMDWWSIAPWFAEIYIWFVTKKGDAPGRVTAQKALWHAEKEWQPAGNLAALKRTTSPGRSPPIVIA